MATNPDTFGLAMILLACVAALLSLLGLAQGLAGYLLVRRFGGRPGPAAAASGWR